MPTATINGFKHYWEDMGSGDEVIIQLHGAHKGTHIFPNHSGFEPSWPGLSKQFRVIAPDMRGMGKSEHVKDMPDSAWVDDVKGLMDHLHIQQAHIHGHSLGSRVALRFAIEHPTRTKSVILTAPHTYLTPGLDAGQNRTGGDATKLTPEQQEEEKRFHGDPGYIEVWRNYHNIRNKVSLQEYYNFEVKEPLEEVVYKFGPKLKDVKAPILMLSSDRGNLRHAMEIKLELPEQCRLAIIPSYPPGALPVEVFNYQVAAFINGLKLAPAKKVAAH